MSLNLNSSQVTEGQNNADVTINDATGRLDAAITETLQVQVDNTNAASVSSENLRSHNFFELIDGSPVPTAAITITLTAIKRGFFAVLNSTSFDATITISGQSETAPIVAPGTTKMLHSDGSNVRGPSASGGVTDHGALTGLADDDHPQYSLADGSRAFTGDVTIQNAAIDVVIDPGTATTSRLRTDALFWQFDVDVDGTQAAFAFTSTELASLTDNVTALGDTALRWSALRVGTGVSSFEGQVGVGIQSPATSAAVDITSTTLALIVSRMNTTQKNALTAVNGMVVYDSTLGQWQFREAGAWVGFSSGAFTNPLTVALDIGTTGSPISADGALRVFGAGAATNHSLIIQQRFDGATVDVAQFAGNRPTKTINDVARIGYALMNTTAVDDIVRQNWKILSMTQATRDGQWSLDVIGGGTFREFMRCSSVGGANNVVFNEDSNTINFRVESDGDANCLFIDGTNDNVGIGTASPNTSAKLAVVSSTSGFVPPRMNNTARQNIAGPQSGLEIYNTDNLRTDVYNGTNWRSLMRAVANVNLTAQAAAIAATTVYTVPNNGAAGNGVTGAEGMYEVTWVATVTTVDTTSSTLGGAAGFAITYTDPDDSVVKTSTMVVNSAANTTGTSISGSFVCNAKANTAIQYSIGYTAGTGNMRYNLHVRVVPLS